MFWTILLGAITLALFLLHPYFDFRAKRKALGIIFFMQLFYLMGYYIWEWPFPAPIVIMQIIVTVGLGVAIGVIFSRIWPLAPKPGFERVMRTFLLVIPSIGLGVGVQILLQGHTPNQALYMIFALSAWLGSGHFVRTE